MRPTTLTPSRIRQPRRRWVTWVLVLLAVFAAWAIDSIARGRLVRPALEQAGYGETITERNLWPRRCRVTDYEAAFWGKGPKVPEAQGFVCIGYGRAPEVDVVGFDEDIGANLFEEI